MDLRCKKCGDALAKAIYKCAITAFGYYVMKDAYFMPTYLGGSGDYLLGFKDHPYTPHVPYLKEYYLICTSYHLGQMGSHLLFNRTNDFIEMILHHTITLYLMVGSYVFNVA